MRIYRNINTGSDKIFLLPVTVILSFKNRGYITNKVLYKSLIDKIK